MPPPAVLVGRSRKSDTRIRSSAIDARSASGSLHHEASKGRSDSAAFAFRSTTARVTCGDCPLSQIPLFAKEQRAAAAMLVVKKSTHLQQVSSPLRTGTVRALSHAWIFVAMI
jgi:hypothetical protein